MLNKISRRQMLQNAGNGFGGLFLASFLEQQLLQAKTIEGLHFPARAKRVIFLFMHGGPSHVDTFDYNGPIDESLADGGATQYIRDALASDAAAPAPSARDGAVVPHSGRHNRPIGRRG